MLEGIHEKRPLAVANVVVKAIHDNLNTWKDNGMVGVPVENDLGKQWLLSGDTTLKSSPETLKWAAQAIEVGRSNLQVAYQSAAGNPRLDEDALVAKVLRYFPRPTQASVQLIQGMVALLTDPRHKKEFTEAVAGVLIRELSSLLAALEKDPDGLEKIDKDKK